MEKKTYCSVYLLPLEKNIIVPKGDILINALIQAGIYGEVTCGGKGTCGKCSAMVLPHKSCKEMLKSDNFSKELTCQYVVNTDITVNAPLNFISAKRKELLVQNEKFILDKTRIKKFFLQLIPERTNSSSDQEIIGDELDKLNINYPKDLEVLRKIPDVLRKSDNNITLVSYSDNVIDIEEGNTTRNNYGIAFDIGTTTIVGSLIDLEKGIALASESSDNPQRIYGADVISRISYVGSQKNGLLCLHKTIIQAINNIINILCMRCKVKKKYIYTVSFLGNTTMMHLLLRINPLYLAVSPYVAAYKFSNCISAKELGVKINPLGKCIIAPNIAGFVGADTVGAILATELTDSKNVNLLIDIGTNGEIVLGSIEKGFLACSAAAGPAFEGAQIKFGMRAVPGAIEKVKITDDVYINTIGNISPVGICGSGIIDCIAELLKAKIINHKGAFSNINERDLSKKISKRIININNGTCFILSFKEDNAIGEDIVITQKDIRQVQLAKGAILAGVRVLQNLLNITDEEISEIQLAGAFGSYIKKESANRIGMLPEIDLNKIIAVGNAAGAGAQKILLSESYYEEALKIAREVKYIELSTSLNFTKEFLKALSFPV